MSIRHRATAVVIYNEKLLVIKRLNNGMAYYVFPGGGVEDGESGEAAAVRELMEETGITGRVVKPIMKLQVDDGSTMTDYLCEYIAGEPSLGDFNEQANTVEGVNTYEPMWLLLRELPDNLFPNGLTQYILSNYNEGFPDQVIVSTVTREHLDNVNKKYRQP